MKDITIRVGQSMKWAPMLARDVLDPNTGVDLVLHPDGRVTWKPVPGTVIWDQTPVSVPMDEEQRNQLFDEAGLTEPERAAVEAFIKKLPGAGDKSE